MKRILFFVSILLFLTNVNAETVTQYSHGYDEYTGVCSNDSFYYILEDNQGSQGYGQFSHTYDAHFVKIRADINYQLVPNTTYELTFSNPIHDYNSGPNQYGWTAITTSSVAINIENGCGGTIMRPVVVTDVSYPNSTAYDRDLVVITFTTSDYVAKPWFSVTLESGYISDGIYQITTGGKARLDNIYLTIKNDTGDTGDATNQDVINNDKQNTQDIINNQNQSTQDIINNQNENTQKQIESQQSCKYIDKSNISFDNKGLNDSGVFYSSQSQGVTDYFNILNSTIKILQNLSGATNRYCFYDTNKVLISCSSTANISNTLLTIPEKANYIRFTINKDVNKPQYYLCTNGSKALENTLTDDNINSDTGTSFFNNFQNQDFGLSQIITIPLSTIQSLTSKSCVTINVPIPYTNRNVQLPCMFEIYNKFPTIYNLWKIVSFGIISYFICIDIFHIVKGFKDPESDKVEVLDL